MYILYAKKKGCKNICWIGNYIYSSYERAEAVAKGMQQDEDETKTRVIIYIKPMNKGDWD